MDEAIASSSASDDETAELVHFRRVPKRRRRERDAADYGVRRRRRRSAAATMGALRTLASRRYYVAFMGFLGFVNIYTMRTNLSVAILQMTDGRNVTDADGTVHVYPAEFGWSSVTTGVILSAFFYGYIVTQIPGGWAARIYGGRRTFCLGILGTGALTVLTPPVAKLGSAALIALRVVEGLFEGATYPAMHALWSHWAPPAEKTKLATIAFSGSYFGAFVAGPLSATLGAKYGWPCIFYVFGIVGLVWCGLWYVTVADTVDGDIWISSEEAAYIKQSIGEQQPLTRQRAAPPWLKIFTSKAVWAICIAHFTETWSFYTMLTYLPKYMEDVLGMNLEKASWASSLPYLAKGALLIICGQLSDVLRQRCGVRTVTVRRCFTTGAYVLQAAATAIAVHMADYAWAEALITLSVAMGGVAWAGFSANHLDVAPQYASILMGMSNTLATLSGMVSPVIVGAVVTQGTRLQWQIIFYMSSAISLLGGIIYSALASGDVQPWATVAA